MEGVVQKPVVGVKRPRKGFLYGCRFCGEFSTSGAATFEEHCQTMLAHWRVCRNRAVRSRATVEHAVIEALGYALMYCDDGERAELQTALRAWQRLVPRATSARPRCGACP